MVGVVNTLIVIAAALGMVKRRQPFLLECNGGVHYAEEELS